MVGRWRDSMRGLDKTWIIVGCGGGAYYGLPYLRVETQTARLITFVDPDVLEGRNRSRQWPMYPVGEPKIGAARRMWGKTVGQLVQTIQAPIQEVEESRLILAGQPQGVIICALPDNDAARLYCCELAERLSKRTEVAGVGIATAGNETWRGQAFWGAVGPEGWVYDWRDTHAEDVVDDAGRGTGCGQLPQSNVLTMACFAWAVREMLHGSGDAVHEWWWMRLPVTEDLSIRVNQVQPKEVSADADMAGSLAGGGGDFGVAGADGATVRR